MRRRQLTLGVAFAAALAVSIATTILVYSRLQPAATASAPTPFGLTPIAVPAPSPSPLPTMGPPPWIQEPTGVPPGVYTVPPNYGRTFPSGFGPPHAASLAEIGARPGCDPATSAPDPYGACGWGAFIRCDDNPWTPACNQRLSNGMTCGFGLQDCIAAQLNCHLPITGGYTVGGFYNFPKGDFTPDPASNTIRMRWPPHHPLGISYDRAVRRWVPTSITLISPDGSHDAEVDQQWTVHDVGIVAGTDRVVSPSGSWLPLAYTDAGIYGVPFDPKNGPGAGLWLLQAEHSTAISRTGYWSIVGGGAAYGHPTQNPAQSPGQLARLDLKSGKSAIWFRRPQQYIDVIGFDGAGHPIVLANGGQWAGVPVPGYREIWIVSGPNSGVKLVSGVLDIVPSSMSDTRGIWLGSGQGVYLLTVVADADGVPHPIFARVATLRSQPPAGRCA